LETGKTHSPAHFELLFASKNTEEAMKEWDGLRRPSPKNRKDEKTTESVAPKKVSPPKRSVQATSPPKFKMPVSKAPTPAISVVSKDIEATPKVNRALLKPVLDAVQQDSEATVKRIRTSARRSSIRHAEPTFRTPLRLDDHRQSMTFSVPPSVQATPLTKRSAGTVRKPRASSMKPPVAVVPPPIRHAELALEELAAHLKPLNPSKADLKKPLSQYLQSLIDERVRAFDEELGRHLSNFDVQLRTEV
jgi:hypothetical protein